MNILAFDTSGDYCTIALHYNGKLYAESMALIHGHATHLMPLIMKVMQDAHASFKDLDLISVVNGPGSFTGIRVGVATAHGLSIASKVPLIAISSFELYAHQAADDKDILVLIDSRRNDLFVQKYDCDLNPIGEPHILKPENVDLEGYNVTGNGLKLLESQQAVLLNPDTLINVTKHKWESGQSTGRREDCKPLYLREPDAVIKNSKI